MAMYTYHGLTAYILKNQPREAIVEKLQIMAAIVEPFFSTPYGNDFEKLDAYPDYDEIPDQYNDIASKYKDFYEGDSGFLYAHQFCPTNTPANYTSASITDVTIKGIDMLKIYAPASSARDGSLDAQMTFIELLKDLFGSDVLNVKIKTVDETQSFDKGEIKTMHHRA